ncbi:MAG: NAD(P)-binding domain-containing protein [Brachymonas sp.]|nr:NAD(P)-binding domain-containing protein [Brachymonas sp.]
MKVAILGTGGVAIDLAKGFTSRGHSVVFGTRDPQGETAKKQPPPSPAQSRCLTTKLRRKAISQFWRPLGAARKTLCNWPAIKIWPANS